MTNTLANNPVNAVKPVISFFPDFSSTHELKDKVIRAAWYLSCLKPKTINFLTSELSQDNEIPQHFNQDIKEIIHKLESEKVINYSHDISTDSIKNTLTTSSIIICWSKEDTISERYGKDFETNLRKKGVKIYNIHSLKRMEGSLYIEISKDFYSNNASVIEQSKKKFNNLTESLPNGSDAFLFASGPSIQDYPNFDFQSGVSIICNSVINDEDLMRHVKPSILVFADPIFHFGCSSYTAAFHQKLTEQAEAYNLTIIIPLKYYYILTYHLPHLTDRIIAVPYNKSEDINLELEQEFKLSSTDNILTFLMLPIATSLANSIYLLGCDGRPLDEDNYFWKHDKKTQFTGEMQSIKDAHPSFFKIEYNEYYLRHCDTLERYLLCGEKLGKDYTSLTHSYIPALKSRDFPYNNLSFKNCSTDTIVSINPDLESNFGHYLHYDLRISETLQDNINFISLCSTDCKISNSQILLRPVFSQKTWDFRQSSCSKDIYLFSEILRKEIHQISLVSKNIKIFMYPGDIRYLNAIIQAIPENATKPISFSINLFWSHFDISNSNYTKSRKFTYHQELISAYNSILGHGIQVYTDSPRLKKRLDNLFSYSFPLWPMIAVTDHSKNSYISGETNKKENSKIVFCPSNGQISKGFDLICKAIIEINKSPISNSVTFVIRDILRDSKDNNKILHKHIEAITQYSNVKILKGTLSEADYSAEFEKANVVFLPYRREHFETRTSACLVDSLYFGKRVVAADDTWIGDHLKTFGCDYLYKDGDFEDLILNLTNAIIDPKIPNHSSLKKWEDYFSPQHLYRLISQEASLNTLNTETLIRLKSTSDHIEKKYYPSPSSFTHNQTQNSISRALSTITPSKIRTIMNNSSTHGMPLYTKFALWSQSNNAKIYSIGRFTMWILRKLRKHPIFSIGYLTLICILTTLPLYQPFILLNAISIVLALLVGFIGFGAVVSSYVSHSDNEWKSKILLKIQTLDSQQLKQNSKIDSLNSHSTSIEMKLSCLEDALSENSSQIKNNEINFNSLINDTYETSIRKIQSSAPVFNAAGYQTFNRTLDENHLNSLMKVWSPKLNIQTTKREISYIAHRACFLESQMHGRLATSIENMLLRTLVGLAINKPSISILEIGTLFGTGAAIIYDTLRFRFDNLQLTLIDPLDGYYKHEMKDIITAEPINEKILIRNLCIGGVDLDDVALIKHLSTDHTAVQKVSKSTYDLLIIDGDHSYTGVKFDYENYGLLVRTGGFIIFDDYGSPDWPEVTEYVDKEIIGCDELELVGTEFRSAVFRVN